MVDGSPFRVPTPADRRTVSRPAPAQPQQEVPQPTREEPTPVHRAPTPSHHAPKHAAPKRRFKLPIIIASIILLALIGWFAVSKLQNAGTGIDGSKYQAVFFTNGQVYFGKLQSFNNEYLRLTDVYYLQTQSGETDSENPQQASVDQSNVRIIKLGDEIHGPEDEMIISKDQVLFYENLKADGKVAESIDKFNAN